MRVDFFDSDMDMPINKEMVSLLGPKMAWFVDRCERDHPELAAEPLKSQLAEATELSEVATFCKNRGISAVIPRIKPCVSRIWPKGIFQVRFLKDHHRSICRRQKRHFSLSSQSFCQLFSQMIEDLPSDFSHFREDCSSYSELWFSRSDLFRSAGCQLLASRAAELAGKLSAHTIGLKPLSLKLAAMVLFKRLGSKVVGDPTRRSVVDVGGSPSSVFVRPIDLSCKSVPVPDSVVLSETAIGGYPVFDHHVVVCSQAGKIFLGERDGVFYFVDENYSDCGGE